MGYIGCDRSVIRKTIYQLYFCIWISDRHHDNRKSSRYRHHMMFTDVSFELKCCYYYFLYHYCLHNQAKLVFCNQAKLVFCNQAKLVFCNQIQVKFAEKEACSILYWISYVYRLENIGYQNIGKISYWCNTSLCSYYIIVIWIQCGVYKQ